MADPADPPLGRRPLTILVRDRHVSAASAEALDAIVERRFREGQVHLVVDLRQVEDFDAVGIGALVSARDRAAGLGGHVRFVTADERMRRALQSGASNRVSDIVDTPGADQVDPRHWHDLWLAGVAAAGCLLVVLTGLVWTPYPSAGTPGGGPRTLLGHAASVSIQFTAAAAVGFIINAVHQRLHHRRGRDSSFGQALVLLCVAGALTMIVIGDSLARAFGVAGAAAVVRFRTSIEDPRDTTLLFIVIALGMAIGIGALTVAGVVAGLLCLLLVVAEWIVSTTPGRGVAIELTATDRHLPAAHAAAVFARFGITAALTDIVLGQPLVAIYRATLPPSISVDQVASSLVAEGAHGVASVAWHPFPRRSA